MSRTIKEYQTRTARVVERPTTAEENARFDAQAAAARPSVQGFKELIRKARERKEQEINTYSVRQGVNAKFSSTDASLNIVQLIIEYCKYLDEFPMGNQTAVLQDDESNIITGVTTREARDLYHAMFSNRMDLYAMEDIYQDEIGTTILSTDDIEALTWQMARR